MINKWEVEHARLSRRTTSQAIFGKCPFCGKNYTPEAKGLRALVVCGKDCPKVGEDQPLNVHHLSFKSLHEDLRELLLKLPCSDDIMSVCHEDICKEILVKIPELQVFDSYQLINSYLVESLYEKAIERAECFKKYVGKYAEMSDGTFRKIY